MKVIDVCATGNGTAAGVVVLVGLDGWVEGSRRDDRRSRSSSPTRPPAAMSRTRPLSVVVGATDGGVADGAGAVQLDVTSAAANTTAGRMQRRATARRVNLDCPATRVSPPFGA
jgi:hypothetical protein